MKLRELNQLVPTWYVADLDELEWLANKSEPVTTGLNQFLLSLKWLWASPYRAVNQLQLKMCEKVLLEFICSGGRGNYCPFEKGWLPEEISTCVVVLARQLRQYFLQFSGQRLLFSLHLARIGAYLNGNKDLEFQLCPLTCCSYFQKKYFMCSQACRTTPDQHALESTDPYVSNGGSNFQNPTTWSRSKEFLNGQVATKWKYFSKHSGFWLNIAKYAFPGYQMENGSELDLSSFRRNPLNWR